MSERELKVLVVDDSAMNRRSLSDMLGKIEGVRVVARAANGEEALRLVHSAEPDLITLDLEMPRMDGFTFLRILMAKAPRPVLVISSYAQKENVFKALELGAADFIAKPDVLAPTDEHIRSELTQKVLALRAVRRFKHAFGASFPPALPKVPSPPYSVPRAAVVIAASTGGPSALMEIMGGLPADLRAVVLVAQHMPDKFTRTFSERLDRGSRLRVREAEEGDKLAAGDVLVCPGMKSMELRGTMMDPTIALLPRAAEDRFVPSGNRLFRSASAIFRRRVIAVVLTGMADDGTEGCRAVKAEGGRVLVESEETSVVFGMPRSVIEAKLADRILPLHQIASAIADEVRALDR